MISLLNSTVLFPLFNEHENTERPVGTKDWISGRLVEQSCDN